MYDLDNLQWGDYGGDYGGVVQLCDADVVLKYVESRKGGESEEQTNCYEADYG